MTGMVAPGIVIERGIPVPKPCGRTGATGRKCHYHWDRLAVGDSFVTTTDSVWQMALRWARWNGRAFTSRKTRKGVRVWRTA